MREYEIRILRADRTTDIVFEVAHLTDNAAISAAKKFAEARPFEVWRGLDFVYGSQTETPLSFRPARREA